MNAKLKSIPKYFDFPKITIFHFLNIIEIIMKKTFNNIKRKSIYIFNNLFPGNVLFFIKIFVKNMIFSFQ